MSKYRLVSEYGNRVIYTDNEKEKNQLLERGFYIQNPDVSKTKAPTTKKRKAVSKNERKSENKNRAEGDI